MDERLTGQGTLVLKWDVLRKDEKNPKHQTQILNIYMFWYTPVRRWSCLWWCCPDKNNNVEQVQAHIMLSQHRRFCSSYRSSSSSPRWPSSVHPESHETSLPSRPESWGTWAGPPTRCFYVPVLGAVLTQGGCGHCKTVSISPPIYGTADNGPAAGFLHAGAGWVQQRPTATPRLPTCIYDGPSGTLLKRSH